MATVTLLWKMIACAAMAVIAVGGVYFVDKKNRHYTWTSMTRQVIIGIPFGLLAVGILALGAGLPGDDNIQDVVPLCVGLVFGAPAGLISGFLAGGMAYVLKINTVTPLAISMSLCLAGVFAAFLRQVMFDNKTASALSGLAIGLVYAVFHILIQLVSHIRGLQVSSLSFSEMTLPLIVISSLTVMAALFVVARIGKEKQTLRIREKGIAQTFQRWLLVCVLAAFAATCTYTWMLQTEISHTDAESLLKLNQMDLHASIVDASNKNLLRINWQVARVITPDYYVNEHGDGDFYNSHMIALLKNYNLSEVNLVDTQGIIVSSTNPKYIGFDMKGGAQAAAFIPLLHGEKEIVQKYMAITYNRDTSRKYAGVVLPNGGFVQVGYDAAHFQQSLDEAVAGFTRNKHIGETGGFIISDANGVIISDNSGYEGDNISDMNVVINRDSPVNKSFDARIHGVDSLCMYDRVEGYLIITYIPYQEIMLSRNIAGYITAFMEIVLFSIIFLLIYFLVKKMVVDNIHKINDSLGQITGGNLDVRVDVHANDEFTSLSEDINATVDTLKKYIAEAAARIDKELEFAQQIQMSALPSVFPPYPDRQEFGLYASMDPAREVGGDFYDFYLLDKNHLAVLIADVSGKGIPAAMFMMTAKTLIKSLAESGEPLADVFNQANERLCENNEAGMFVTAWMGILDIANGSLEFVNAGHNPPLVGRSGTFSYLRTPAGFVLGGMEDIQYKSQQLQLGVGDALLLYTDGLTEAMNVDGTLFGEGRVLTALSQQQEWTAQRLVEFLKGAVAEFAGDAEQSDDITMLALTYQDGND